MKIPTLGEFRFLKLNNLFIDIFALVFRGYIFLLIGPVEKRIANLNMYICHL